MGVPGEAERFFEERLGAALHGAGIESGPPEISHVHNMIPRGAGTSPNVIMETRVDVGSDVYDQLVASMDAHVGDGSAHPCYSHVAGVTEAGTMYVIDLWESPEAFGAFADESLAPIAGDRLGEMTPRFVPVHAILQGRAAVSA